MAREVYGITGLETTLARLRALPAEVASKNGGIALSALRKGGAVIRDQMKANVRQIVRTPNIGGGDDESTGLLEASITVRRGKRHAALKGERVWVMVPRRKVYPIGKKVKTQFPVARIGQILEYGSARLKSPHPWAGPAFHARKREAVEVIIRETNRGLDAAERKLKGRVR